MSLHCERGRDQSPQMDVTWPQPLTEGRWPRPYLLGLEYMEHIKCIKHSPCPIASLGFHLYCRHSANIHPTVFHLAHLWCILAHLKHHLLMETFPKPELCWELTPCSHHPLIMCPLLYDIGGISV